MGPGKDTHGTPVPTQCGGREWHDIADQSAVAHRHRSKKLFGIFKFYFILLLGGGASLRLLRVVLPSSALFGWRRHSLW